MRRQVTPVVLGSALLALAGACSRKEVPVGKAIVCAGESSTIELRVLFRTQGRGSAHYPSLRFFDIPDFDSIRLPAREGTFGADAIELRRYEGQWPVRVMSGHVTLGLTSGEIDLRVARYDRGKNEPAGEVPYPMNGVVTIDEDCKIRDK